MIIFKENSPFMHKKRPKNIVLTGVSGSGKSTIGKQLALRIGYGFLDLDSWIEKSEKMSISKIFSKHGEHFFREKETEALEQIKSVSNHVIAVGGGTFQDDHNRELISGMALTIWLNFTPNTIARRLYRDLPKLKERPLLADTTGVTLEGERLTALVERLENQLGQRTNELSESDLHISDTFATVDETVARIKKLIESDQMQDVIKKRFKLKNKSKHSQDHKHHLSLEKPNAES